MDILLALIAHSARSVIVNGHGKSLAAKRPPEMSGLAEVCCKRLRQADDDGLFVVSDIIPGLTGQ